MKQHPNKNVRALAKQSLAQLRKMQDIVGHQIGIAARIENTKALASLQERQREIQAAVMLKEFKEII
jgi:3-methyladenine DNA glycosylase Tag